jgi:hypothetical protein
MPIGNPMGMYPYFQGNPIQNPMAQKVSKWLNLCIELIYNFIKNKQLAKL